MAQVQRTIPLLLPADEDVRETLAVFQRVQQQLSRSQLPASTRASHFLP
jgi:hypothetical protein